MHIMEVFIHVPGDREAVIKCLDENNIEYNIISNRLVVKNSCIYMDDYGKPENILRFNSEYARETEDKPIPKKKIPESDGIYLPYEVQLSIFNKLRRAIMKSREKFYKKTEEKMQKEKEEKNELLRTIQEVIDFENKVLSEEHQLEVQIRKTIAFLSGLTEYFPESTFTFLDHKRIDCGLLSDQMGLLNNILNYLKQEEIEATHILNQSENPIEIEKEGKRIAIQKKHLRKLNSMLNLFVKEIKETLKRNLKHLQITAKMRGHLKEFYTEILKIYMWYSELFKRESKK